MMAFPVHGFVLLAMPKCASTSIESALAPYASLVIDRPPSRKHLGCAGFAKRIEPGPAAEGHPRSSYELVTMFRDPIARLESWWRYRARLDDAVDNSTHDPGFEEFARMYVDGDPTAPDAARSSGTVPHGRRCRRGGPGVRRRTPPTCGRRGSASGSAPTSASSVATSPRNVVPELSDTMRASLEDYFAPEYAVHSRLQETGQWSGAQGTALAVPTRPEKTKHLPAQKS
ncbi:sulfotransferase family protein [Nocardioides sp. B-3]|uniref:sulfotransferase family protein n=1 Tax=Nocardioides sp. B-3 TaxID=2895565 RepID=UPI00215268E3|nr:sulfotransferase family protein [Nocardioides sp. B-3]UUZ59278.1 sulfotransferase family protein [Nocardioides sp. B-3]